MAQVSVGGVAVRQPGEHSFRPDIEGLRGIAVLLVVLYHAELPGLGGGFTGVDVFFVLSGYLITELLVREVDRTGRISFLRFYARRARRLLPAAVLALVATLIVGLLAFSPIEQTRYGKSAVATALYVSNLHFIRQSADYFGVNTATDPFLHTWSLAVEEQFYLVWPLLIALGFALGRRRRQRRAVVALLAFVCLLSFAGCEWLTWAEKPKAFFGSPTRAWEFGLGGLASLLPAAVLRACASWCRVLGWAGLTTLLVGGAALTGRMLFPGPWALVPVLGTVAALVAGVGAPDVGIGRVLGSRPLQFVGRLSYSWYLWHWPVLVIAGVLFPGLPLAARLAFAFGALGLAWVSHLTVENPIRFHPVLVPRPALSLGLAGVLSAAALAAALGARHHARAVTARPPQRELAQAALDRSDLYARHCVAVPMHLGRRRDCEFGDSTSPITLVLLGDSHAAHWFSTLQRIAEERRWRLVSMVMAGCPPAAVPVFDSRVGRPTEGCDEWRRESLRRIIALRPTAVILTHSVGYVKREGKREGYLPVSLDEWEAGYRRTLAQFDAGGVRTILLRDSPRLEIDVPVCLSHSRRRGLADSTCARPRAYAVDDNVHRAERRAAANLSNVMLLDLTDLFCGPEECRAVLQNLVVYSDDNHLTATYARSIAPAVAEQLVPLLARDRELPVPEGTAIGLVN